MVSSILTNNGALTALQSLKATQKSLLNTQNRISTGLKVATAKDNAATWAVATSMRSDIANTKQVSENLSVSSSIIATAQTASETIADLVKQIRVKVTSSQNPAVDKAQVQSDIDGFLKQIASTVDAASFKGVNLISSDGNLNVLTSVNSVGGVSTAAYANIAKQDLTLKTGGLLESLKDLTVLSRADEVMANRNDGVTKTTFTTGGALALKSGNTVNLDYIDAEGANRVLTVKLDKDISLTADLVTYLNKDAGFSANFTAQFNATTGFSVSTTSRDSTLRVGSKVAGAYTTATSLEIKAGTSALSGLAGSASLGLGAVASTGVSGSVRTLDMTFSDAPLEVGDEFVLKTQLDPALPATLHTYKLRVVDDGTASGAVINSGSDTAHGIYTIAIAAADVTNPNVSGKDIATVLAAALIAGSAAWGTSEITGTAAANTSFAALVNSTGTLSITSNGPTTTDDLLSFNTSATNFDVLLGKLDKAGSNVTNAAAAFGTAATRIDLQKEFLDKLSDTLTTGLGALVDADMSEEAARLQALQVQEQLGTQALSIANQAPQSILSLFQ